jgi:class 3 adenylate cyclase
VDAEHCLGGIDACGPWFDAPLRHFPLDDPRSGLQFPIRVLCTASEARGASMATHDISLADLTQDIAGALPPDLVLRWNESDKSLQTHQRLLEPYLLRGTIVSMDAAGLSKLTQRRSLAEVLKLVSEPKEVLHAFGKAIGGRAIGVWAADNAQMFFPETIEPAAVFEQMRAAQRRGSSLTVKMGIGMHWGNCVAIAGGLFGDDADFIEEIAENHTHGGEIVVSESVYARLPEALRAMAAPRTDLAELAKLWSITSDTQLVHGVEGDDVHYPTPFDDVFFQKLRTSSLEQLAREHFDEYRKNATVVFVKINHPHKPMLLDGFTDLSLADVALRRTAIEFRGDVVKSTGALAIVLLPDEAEALEFARAVVRAQRTLGANARVGIAKGDVFLFPLAGTGRDIAGHAVNVASKLSEDAGVDGILVEESATTPRIVELGRHFQFTISGVEISACVIQP